MTKPNPTPYSANRSVDPYKVIVPKSGTAVTPGPGRGGFRQELIEIARAVILMNRYESEARSGDQLVLLEETAHKAQDVLAALGESTE